MNRTTALASNGLALDRVLGKLRMEPLVAAGCMQESIEKSICDWLLE